MRIVRWTNSGGFPAPDDKPIVIDAETHGNGSTWMVGVGWNPDEVYVLPADVFTDLWPAWCNKWFVGQSINADRRWLGDSVQARRWDDVMLKAHLVDENQPSTLKHLGPHFVGLPDWFSHIMPRLRNDKLRDTISEDELAEYCANDVRATLLVNRHLDGLMTPELRAIYNYVSRPLQDVLFATAEKTGWPLDVERARAMYEAYEEIETDYSRSKRGRKVVHKRGRGTLADRIAELELQLNTMAGHVINWGSTKQVAHLLYDELEIPVPKFTETGESTDVEALMKVRDQHPIVPVLLKHRKVVQRAEMLTTWLGLQRDGRVYSEYNIAGTVTGRLSGRGPNPQNIPTDKEIRSLVVAREGHVILAADYKTLELGFASWQYGEPTMLAAYRRGDDLHTFAATGMLGRPPVDSDERKRFGKTPNFGLTYQQGVDGYRDYAMKMGVDLTTEKARSDRAAWHTMFPGIRAGWHRIGEFLQTHGYVESLSGRRRRLPEFQSGRKFERNRAWRQACNAMVQSPAGELTHCAAIIAGREIPGLILDVHDSLVFEVPKEKAWTYANRLRNIMEGDAPLYFGEHLKNPIEIPVRVDVGAGPSWGELSQVT